MVSAYVSWCLLLSLNYQKSITTEAQLLPTFQNLIETVSRVSPAFRELELDALIPAMPFYDKDVSNVKFYLQTSDSKVPDQQLILNDSGSMKRSSFDPTFPVKILIHGWSQSAKSRDFPGLVSNAYLEMANRENGSLVYNIICVDWGALSREFLYYNSAMYTEKVGRRVGEFIVFLKLGNFISYYNQVHMVGFSLGAQVAGVAGYFVSKTTGGIEKVGRITGLDVAGPGFSSDTKLNQRLDFSDGDFVDVIHTNMGSLLLGELGTPYAIGHADFYPNGGTRQPGCELSLITEYSVPRRSSCHHMKAIDYFAKSIQGANYIGCKCKDWNSFRRQGDCLCDKNEEKAMMGEYCNKMFEHNDFLI